MKTIEKSMNQICKNISMEILCMARRSFGYILSGQNVYQVMKVYMNFSSNKQIDV
jgi:hypothetical protein